MPDAARIAQAQALEIPVTVQGAKPADGTGRRELFTESAKTTLTFDNGAVLNLRTRVTPGQSLFLRNDQSGLEILCKVLEAPAEGEPGYTDLEFMETVPGFWEGDAEEPQAAVEKPEALADKFESQTTAEQPEPAAAKSEAETVAEQPQAAASEAEMTAQSEPAPPPEMHIAPANEGTEAAAENSLAMMSATASEVKLPPAKAPEEETSGPPREILVPAHEMVPETPPAPSPTEPTGEQIDAALRTMVAVPAGAHDDGAESSDAKDKANLAALMARDAKLANFAKRAALKESVAAGIGRSPTAEKASKGAEGAKGPESTEKPKTAEGADGAGNAIEEEVGPPKVPLMDRLTTGKNLIYSEIAVSVAIVVAFFFIWHAVGGLIIHPSERPVAAVARASKAAPPKAPLPVVVQTPAAAPVAKVNAATPPSGNAPVAKVPVAPPAVVTRAPVVKIVRPFPSPSQSGPETVEEDGPHVVEPDPSEPPEDVARAQPKDPENIPAKIVTESQPPLPPWAKTLDVGTVVRLDALIDENGDLGETRILSGPRLLERAAQQAVQLWIFEPAQLDGKPVATHIILTVEFQR